MSTLYPTAKDSYTAIDSSSKMNSGATRADTVINGLQDAVVALQTKVGVNSSAVTTTHDYKLSGVTGTDKAMSLTGTEVATNKTLTSPTINNGTINTPTLTVNDNVLTIQDNADTSKKLQVEASSISASTTRTWTAPDASGTVLLDTATQTVTNKTVGTTNLISFNSPQGFLINGRISVTVASNNITVALKGLDGNDPSATNPVYIRINNNIRSITGALSVTKNAGTNWFNSGSAELAAREIDYFVYLAWDSSNSAVRIGFARYSHFKIYSDFSATTTNEKYGAFSTNPGATDDVEVIGRFAATLSAGAGYTWTIPTFTTKNLIQTPFYHTRPLTYLPTYTGEGGMTVVGSNTQVYMVGPGFVYVAVNSTNTSSVAGYNSFTISLPLTVGTNATCAGITGQGTFVSAAVQIVGNILRIYKYDNSNHALGANLYANVSAYYLL